MARMTESKAYDKDKAPVQRKAAETPPAKTSGPSKPSSSRLQSQAARGGGRSASLPGSVQRKMDRTFGSDARPNIQVGSGVAERAGKSAVTTGDTVHVAQGKYAPETPRGQSLLAHEMAHVVQQKKGSGSSARRSTSAVESEANRAVQAYHAGQPAKVGSDAAGTPRFADDVDLDGLTPPEGEANEPIPGANIGITPGVAVYDEGFDPGDVAAKAGEWLAAVDDRATFDIRVAPKAFNDGALGDIGGDGVYFRFKAKSSYDKDGAVRATIGRLVEGSPFPEHPELAALTAAWPLDQTGQTFGGPGDLGGWIGGEYQALGDALVALADEMGLLAEEGAEEGAGGGPEPQEFHTTAEAKMGPITALLRIDLYVDQENPDEDGMSLELDFLQLPAPQVSDALSHFQANFPLDQFTTGADPLKGIETAFKEWFADYFVDTAAKQGVDLGLAWDIKPPVPIAELRAAGVVGTEEEEVVEALPIIFQGGELVTRYANFIGGDDSDFGGVLSGVLPDMVEGKLPPVEFIGTDSLHYVIQVYNGLVDQPGDQAKFVEEILAMGILAEIMAKIAAGEGALAELGLGEGVEPPDEPITVETLMGTDDPAMRVYLGALAATAGTVSLVQVFETCVKPYMEASELPETFLQGWNPVG